MMRAFNHELSSERIRFGICWRPLEYCYSKVPTIFRVICKLHHNMCMDRWMINNPGGARLGILTSNDCMQFSDDSYLWETFDISVGLDDVFEQPTMQAVCTLHETFP
mmetsp:Transcript_3838/g.5704  ORF Transcript_3838/g.5704 Transcript_3838/m.5704 type:complete len:107 (+) Transcript_3838:824-1144(+)